MFVEIHSHLLMFVHESKSIDNRVNWFSVIKVSIIHNKHIFTCPAVLSEAGAHCSALNRKQETG